MHFGVDRDFNFGLVRTIRLNDEGIAEVAFGSVGGVKGDVDFIPGAGVNGYKFGLNVF